MKKFFLTILIVCIMQVGMSQVKVAVSYPISFPVGDLNEWVDQTSFRGINLEIYSMVKTNLAAGVEAGWSLFYKREDEKVYTDGTASISGVQYRYTNTVPILGMVRWYKEKKDSKTMPFFGLGVGTLYADRYTDFGLYRITNDTWQFCLRPEIGFMFNTDGPGLFLSGKYYAGFATDDLDGQSYFSINIGIALN